MKFLKSKFFKAAGSLVLLVIIVFWGREAWHRYQVEREIKKLQAEIAEVQSGSEKLEEALSYLRTPEYKERQARALLGLQKPGEFVVALPQSAEDKTPEDEAESASGGNLRQWWLYFFGNK